MMIIITAINEARPVLQIVIIMIALMIKSRCRPAPLAFAENGGRVGTR
ncbi:hypothetical protein [Hyphomicrobium sp.]